MRAEGGEGAADDRGWHFEVGGKVSSFWYLVAESN